MIHTLRSVPSSGNRVEEVVALNLSNNEGAMTKYKPGILSKVAGDSGRMISGIPLVNLCPFRAHE